MQRNVLWILLSQDILHKFMSQKARTSAVHHLEVTEEGEKEIKKKGLGVFLVYCGCDPRICHCQEKTSALFM